MYAKRIKSSIKLLISRQLFQMLLFDEYFAKHVVCMCYIIMVCISIGYTLISYLT